MLDVGVFLAVLRQVDGEVVALDGAVADRAVLVVLVGVAALATV